MPISEDDKTILKVANRAIDDGRHDEARSLLKPLMKRNVSQAYYVASKVAKTQEQALKLLRTSVKLDPNNTHIKDYLKELEDIYMGVDKAVPISKLVSEPVPDDVSKIPSAVRLFEDYGWNVVAEKINYAQFMRKPRLTIAGTFFAGVIANVFGLIWIIVSHSMQKHEHAMLQKDEQHLMLSFAYKNIELDQPEQVLIFLEDHRSISIGSAVVYCVMGIIISTLLIALVISQGETFRDWMMTVGR